MDKNAITFVGKNEQLFTRVQINEISQKLTLIVPETHNAILLKDGQMLQTLSSGKYLISKFVDLKTEVDSDIEVLFMSKTAKLKLLWGSSQKFLLYDAVVQENYHVGMSGDFEVQIGDPRKCYLYLVGVSNDLTADALQERLMSNVVSCVESVVSEYTEKNEIQFNKLSLHKKEMASKAMSAIGKKLSNEYGIAVFSFNISNVIIDDDDLKRLTSDYKSLNKKEKTVDEMFCPSCGTKILYEARFCSMCGSKIVRKKVCEECFTENPGASEFCFNCGAKLK